MGLLCANETKRGGAIWDPHINTHFTALEYNMIGKENRHSETKTTKGIDKREMTQLYDR